VINLKHIRLYDENSLKLWKGSTNQKALRKWKNIKHVIEEVITSVSTPCSYCIEFRECKKCLISPKDICDLSRSEYPLMLRLFFHLIETELLISEIIKKLKALE